MLNKKENTFVIMPPEKGSAVFLVKSKDQFEKETKWAESYIDALDLIFFNKEGVLSENEHFDYLESILPPLAIILQMDFPEETKEIVELFLASEEPDSLNVKTYGAYDYTTTIVFILMKHMGDYSDLRSESGTESADLKYGGVNNVLTLAFMRLPFYLISSLSTKFSKKMAKKSKKSDKSK